VGLTSIDVFIYPSSVLVLKAIHFFVANIWYIFSSVLCHCHCQSDPAHFTRWSYMELAVNLAIGNARPSTRACVDG